MATVIQHRAVMNCVCLWIKELVVIYIVKPINAPLHQIYFILRWHSTCFGRFFRPSSGGGYPEERAAGSSETTCCR